MRSANQGVVVEASVVKVVVHKVFPFLPVGQFGAVGVGFGHIGFARGIHQQGQHTVGVFVDEGVFYAVHPDGLPAAELDHCGAVGSCGYSRVDGAVDLAVGFVVIEQQAVLLGAFYVHICLPARFFGVEVKVAFLVAVNRKFDIGAAGVDKEVKSRFEFALLVFKHEQTFGRQAGGVESVGAAGIVVAQIHHGVGVAIDEEREAVALWRLFLVACGVQRRNA